MKPLVRSRLLFYGGAATVVVVDQIVKFWVARNLPAYTPVNPIPSLSPVFSFTFVKNTGVAFGMFPQFGGIFRFLTAFVILGILLFQRTLSVKEVWLHLTLGLVTGGALGNLLDRFTRGFVVDFLDVNFWPFRLWPVFNVADSAIVVGVALLLIDSFFTSEEVVTAGA